MGSVTGVQFQKNGKLYYFDSNGYETKTGDYVIVDTPPTGMFPDAEILADRVDASMLVVRQDYTAACDINDAIDSLRQCKASFLGCVLNDMLMSSHRKYGYGGGRYGYGNKYNYGGSGRHPGKRKAASKDTREGD